MGPGEFLTVRDGPLVPVCEDPLEPIRCVWRETPVESLLAFGTLWVCPACFGEASRSWNGRR